MRKSKSTIFLVVALIATLLVGIVSVQAASKTDPSFSVSKVRIDESITILTRNFPANTDFVVEMKPLESTGEYISVAKFNSMGGGSFSVEFPIPEALFGVSKISMLLSSDMGLVIHSSFEITAAPQATLAPTEPVTVMIQPVAETEVVLAQPQATVVAPDQPVNEPVVLVNPILNQPTQPNYPVQQRYPAQPRCNRCLVPMFKIVSVVRGESVEVETQNFPLNTQFNVRMGYFTDPKTCTQYGCFIPSEMGKDKLFVGFDAGTYNSGENAKAKATFTIPAAVKYMSPLYIRFDEVCGGCGYYSFNYFWNNTYPVVK